MLVRLINLNGKVKTCACGDELYDVKRFVTESSGKHYRHLSVVATCEGCGTEIRVRTGKIRNIEVIA